MFRISNMKNMKMMKFSELSFFVIKSEIRKLNKIWNNLTFIFKFRVISFLIFLIMTIFLWIEWNSENVISWLCVESTIFKIQMSVLFSRVIVQKKTFYASATEMFSMLICKIVWFSVSIANELCFSSFFQLWFFDAFENNSVFLKRDVFVNSKY